MARIGDDDIRRVREATDIVQLVGEHVVLKQKGRLFWGCCPFHHEKTPSFKIDPGTQLWHCFGCGKGGDVFGYLMEAEKLEFPEAVRQLADRAHIEIKEEGGRGLPRGQRQRLMEACAKAEEFFHTQLMRSRGQEASAARNYLGSRGFGSAPSKNWKLGFAPGHGQLVSHLQKCGFSRDELIQANLAYANQSGRLVDRFYNRVMFPVHDLQGNTIAFGGRIIGQGEPKYLNTSETPVFHKSSNMFGIDKAKSAIVAGGTAIVVEGYTDVISLHEAGICNAVATLGTALTAQHVKLLSRFATTIVYLFDGDAAGQKAALRAAEFIDWNSAVESRRDPIELKVAVLPDNLDPAEFVAAKGAEALRNYVAGAEPLLKFAVNRKLDAYDLSKPELKSRAMEDALSVLLPIKESILAAEYVNIIADRLKLDYNLVFRVLKEMKAPAIAHREEDNAPLEHGTSRTGTLAAQVVEAVSKSARMEFELISLIVAEPSVLTCTRDGLRTVDWEDIRARNVVNALLVLGEDASSAECYAAAQQACPDASSLLGKYMSAAEDKNEALLRARLLVRMLHERDVESQIKDARLRMNNDASLSPQEMDELFEKTIRLQKELAELRNNSQTA